MKAELIRWNALDFVKYQQCFDTDLNADFFMQSWVLEALCEQCSAIVFDDYQAIFPVPNKRKYFIPYVYQVPFIQRFSCIGNFNDEMIHRIASLLKIKFPYIHLDTANYAWPKSWIQAERKNFILPLQQNYPSIYQHEYDNECKRNLDKAHKRGCSIEPSTDWQGIIELYHTIYGSYSGNHLHTAYDKALIFLQQAVQHNACEGYKIFDKERNLLFAGIIIKSKHRLYYWLGAPTEKGRQHRVTYFFIDYLIQANAAKNLVFDFEGSDFPNVARFYSRFTKNAENYLTIKHRLV